MTEATQATQPKTKITLDKLGPALPLGILHKGQYVRDIAVRPWRMKEEREVGAAHAAKKDANVAEYVSTVLAMMCTRLGPHDFSAMEKLEDRQAAISQMFMGDVFYAYMFLRVHALGPDLRLKIKVPGKKDDVTYVADLSTTEIVVPSSFEAMCFDYKLKTPIVIRGLPVESLRLGPIRWSNVESDRQLSDGNIGAAKGKVIRSAIISADSLPSGAGSDLLLTESELDELSKFDLERLASLIDANVLGPVMRIEDEYEGKPFKVAIDWRYDNFFGVSSD